MPRELLKLVWTKRLYFDETLKTIDGTPLTVINHGQVNTAEESDKCRVDITGAAVQIGSVQYRGNIAINCRTSDVKNLSGDLVSVYDNIILLVVGEADTIICRSDGSIIPTTVIKYDPQIDLRYEKLLAQSSRFGCAQALMGFKPIDRYTYLTRLTIERLERKHNDFKKLYTDANHNWYEAFYVTLFGTMGTGTNKEAYIKLSKTVPYHIICRHKDSVFDMESLLLGGSGLLNTRYPDEYTSNLMKRFEELRKTFNIIPMRANEWDLSGNKPNHHPILRIVELASLLASRELLFAQLMKCRTPKDVRKVLAAEASEYWTTHYTPGNKSRYSVKRIGTTMMNALIINLVVPMIATYGKIYNNEELLDVAIELLEQVSAEHNRYTTGWESGGIELENAFFSQGFIQLSKEYCKKKRCTECNIGEILLSC